jgi:hypothetical protein
MTELLEKAIAEVSNLSDEEQDAIGAMIQDVIADEQSWDAAFAKSHDKLAKLAESVKADIGAGSAPTLTTTDS